MAVCFRRTRRATISAAIVSGRITFEFEGSKGEEAGRRRGERWDQDHSVDRLMRCNTVAITDPSLLPPLLSPFFFSLSLSLLPSTYPSSFRFSFDQFSYTSSTRTFLFPPFSSRIEQLSRRSPSNREKCEIHKVFDDSIEDGREEFGGKNTS